MQEYAGQGADDLKPMALPISNPWRFQRFTVRSLAVTKKFNCMARKPPAAARASTRLASWRERERGKRKFRPPDQRLKDGP